MIPVAVPRPHLLTPVPRRTVTTSQWPLLFKRNRAEIEDADLIYPGQVLHIDRDANEHQIQQAIEHAKTRGAWSLGVTEASDLEYLARAQGS